MGNSFSYTVAAVFKVALQYSPRCNIARRQSEILAIEPALQYSPQPIAPLLMSITKDWCKRLYETKLEFKRRSRIMANFPVNQYTLDYLINMQDVIIMQAGKFTQINKRAGCNKAMQV